ncbi:serine/threonine-protein kinase [Microbacterium sp. ASV49]|uniref:non-specific serine/threonine protein kinase n=1 Tax=Microbacterium candidum TaxID=3041922 RepID=A0ABT7N2P6_9MICO|nr:serine/threonine-protein kinase [Microbacterium sp. ASV49]MDL9980989.1 serine/threonine-protein kinase [Microbacterium sp. ASV49]
MTQTRRLQRNRPAVGGLVAGRYRITDMIGRGGMAEIYRATDETLGREVALKIFRPEYASADDLDRQQGEVRLLARLSHQCLVTLFDAIADADGRAVLVLEFVAGSDARHRLRHGPIDQAAVGAIGADIARALGYIHSQGVIHRDVSPANILLPESDHAVAAKLTDLGIARLVDAANLTATGSVIGTASYMSPEQVAGWGLTPATDIYSLGLVLLECLTGRREFEGNPVEAASARLARDPEIPVRLGSPWWELLRAMTARDPARRPTAEEVVSRLSRLPDQAIVPDADAPVDDLATIRLLLGAESDDGGSTRATLIMPAPDPAPTPTRRMDHAASVAPRPPRSRTMVLVIGLLAAVAGGIIAFMALTATTRSAPDPVSSYPAVSGQLGEHLKQLEHQVSTGTKP